VDPAGGGPIESVRQLAVATGMHGHETDIVSLDAPDAPYLSEFPVAVHALGPRFLKYGYSSRFVPWLQENAKHYDVVVVNGLWEYQSFAVWRALHGTATPYVVFSHGMLDPWFKKTYPLKHLKKLLYWPWAEYRVLRDAAAVLFTCEEERVLARQSFRHYVCREIVVNFGTASPTVDRQSGVGEFYARYPELRNKRVAIFLGRIHEKKGCDLLIEAFARVLAGDTDWHLLICGPDQTGLKAKLERLAEDLNISDRVTWTGMIGGDLKWGALRASEIFVLPSHQENFGIVVAEALACGVPALISNKVNIWHEVQRDGAGIIGNDDVEGSCAMLKTWLEMTSDEKSEMKRKTRECFLQRFEIHNAAENLLGVLSGIAGKRAMHAHD
jgi:glycosyltransferase involved in cell wall biosynthesis